MKSIQLAEALTLPVPPPTLPVPEETATTSLRLLPDDAQVIIAKFSDLPSIANTINTCGEEAGFGSGILLKDPRGIKISQLLRKFNGDLDLIPEPFKTDLTKSAVRENILAIDIEGITISKANFLKLISRFPHLTSLKISGPEIDGSCVLHIAERYPNLITLTLQSRTIVDADLLPLRALSKLQNFSLLYATDFSGDGLQYLISSKQMRSLSLEGCTNFRDSGLTHLAQFRELQYLNLANCWDISDSGIEPLEALKKLRKIELTLCCNVTYSGVEFLQENLPNLTVLGP